MSARPSPPDHETPASLRAALLSPPAPRAAAPPAHGALAAEPVREAALPTAPELLAASPNLQRLCESYHLTRRRLVARGRRQRLGLAAMVCAIGVTCTVLMTRGSLPQRTLDILMIATGLATAAGLGFLAMLWVRDERRMRAAQGERLLRALQFNCALPEESLTAFRRVVQPTTAFFDCYSAWKLEHPDRRSALSIFADALSGRRASPAAN